MTHMIAAGELLTDLLQAAAPISSLGTVGTTSTK